MSTIPVLNLDAIPRNGPMLGELLATPEQSWSPALRSAALALQQALREFHRMLLRPGTLIGDVSRLYSSRWQTEEREAAIARLVAPLPPVLKYHPEAKRELVRQAEQRELSQDQLLRTRYFPAGVLLVADDAHRSQQIWLGKDVVVAQGGIPVVMAPRDLPVDLFVQWLRFHVPNAAAANLLGLEYPSDPQDALAPGRYLLDAEIPAPDPLLALMEREFPVKRVAALVANASPHQRQLLSLVQRELEQRDLLPLVEGQRPQPEHFHGLKKALARQLGVSPARISQMLAQLRKIDQHF